MSAKTAAALVVLTVAVIVIACRLEALVITLAALTMVGLLLWALVHAERGIR